MSIFGALAITCVVLAPGASPPSHHATSSIRWDARAVEHLLNRAGFGATQSEIERGVAMGREALVAELVDGPSSTSWVDVEPTLFRWEDFGLDILQVTLPGTSYYGMTSAEQVAMCKDSRVVDRNQFLELNQQWFASMTAGADPLRDRMTLYWHGFFTTSWEVVKRKYELIRQFQWLRREAVANYADLLHGIVRDPAMLQYLDQTASAKDHPNENLARELFELFSLGEGNYSEVDIREAARALTGNRCASNGSFEFLADAHDDGSKSILGRTANFGDRELVDQLLAQDACPRWIARRIVRWIEGVEPGEERVARYAQLLRDERFELRPFFRTLFQDPDFYREDVVGTRVLSPVEYLAFAGKKLGVRPNGHFLNKAGVVLGQSFYAPPSVKGWPEGLDWVTNDALLRRGNVLGAMLGVLEVGVNETAIADDGTTVANAPDLETLIRTLDGERYEPRAELVASLKALTAHDDRSIAAFLLEEWLPSAPTPESTRLVVDWLAKERDRRGMSERGWLDDAAVRSTMLRRLAHLVFSLPEAHLG